MKIAIISDLHDNQAYLERFISWTQRNRIDQIISCGDMTNNDTVSVLEAGFPGKIYIAKGNGDTFDENNINIKKARIIGRQGEIIEIEGIKIGLCHEPKNIESLSQSQPDYIFYGHTHKPHLEKAGMTIIANPGTLGAWRYPSSFALLDTENRELKLIISEEEKI